MEINQERIVETFLHLVGIDSPSKREGRLAGYLVDRLNRLGLSVKVDSCGKKIGGQTGNIIAVLPGRKDRPPILFASHLDTVEPAEGIRPIIKDGIIYSDETTVLAADDKAGVAIILEAIETLKERGIATGDIEILLTVAEELGMLGAKNLDRDRISSQMGFILDGDADVGGIINHVPSRIDFVIEVIGRSSHAGSEPEKGINAIQVAAAGLARCRLGRIDEETTINIGLIRGGTAVNIVPEKAILEGEVRSRTEAKMLCQLEDIEKIFNKAAEESGGKAYLKAEKSFDGYLVDGDEEVVRRAAEAARSAGLVPQLVAAGIGSDMNILNQYGIRSVILGLGIRDAHTRQEHISIQDLTRAACWILAIMKG